MKGRHLLLVIALAGAPALAFAAPAINFATANFTSGGSWPNFNTAQVDQTSFAGIVINGYTYSQISSTAYSYNTSQGYLWLRNNSSDHGLGYCSTSENCGYPNTTGNGDWNELSNENKTEIIRLTLPTGKVWTDLQVSSLDEGGTNGNETGTFYWSNSATINLASTTNFINFSHDSLWGSGSSTVEGSIFSYLVGHGFDPTSQYLFFRAGQYDGAGNSTNGTNNDYLVWGANITTAVPEPESYAMLLAGLGLLGFMARIGKQRTV